MKLFREILNRIVHETEADGKVITQRAAASSINLPIIDEQSTRQQMALLMRSLLRASDAASVRRQLQTAICDIKALYTETHDGFSQAKGIRVQDRIKLADMVAFSVAAGYCFQTLPPVSDATGHQIAIGVMAPASGWQQEPHQVGLAGSRPRSDRSWREPQTASLAECS